MLFLKECKKIIFSLTYIVYFVAVVAIYATQFDGVLNEPIKEPTPDDEYYGLIQTEDEDIIMNSAVATLLYEYEMNTYVSYPFGLYKEVKLNQSEKEQMKEIINELTESDNWMIKSNLTYEEALADYESIMQEDELAKVHIRLFCDYLGIVLGFMPIFVCAALWQADRRSGVEQLIFSRKISSVKLVGTRYLALLGTTLIPVILTYMYAMIRLGSIYGDINLQLIETFGLMLLWLLPEIMIVLSVGTFFAVCRVPLCAVFVQIIWWFSNVLVKQQLSGGITKWDLVVRHNTLSDVQLFYAQWNTFVWNRVFYAILAVLLLMSSFVIYEYQRKGNTNGKKMLHKNIASKSEA